MFQVSEPVILMGKETKAGEKAGTMTGSNWTPCRCGDSAICQVNAITYQLHMRSIA